MKIEQNTIYNIIIWMSKFSGSRKRDVGLSGVGKENLKDSNSFQDV